MKKIFALLLTICLCMGMIIPMHAAEGMTVSGESAVGQPGTAVAVKISLANNPGFAYIRLALSFDAEALALDTERSASSTGALTFAAGATMVSWDSAENYTENGEIGVLYFNIAENAECGEYPLGISLVECYDINTDDVAVTTVGTTVVVDEPESSLIGANVDLGTDISVNYYVELDPAHEGAQMKFNKGGNEVVVDGVETETAGTYVYSYCGLAPQCLGDTIDAQLVLGDSVLATMEDYSVRTYCDELLAMSAEELGLTAEKHAQMKTLVADLLEYGAAAQVYRNYKTDALVNEGITGQTEFVELTETNLYVDESGLDGVMMNAIGVYFDYTNSFYLEFDAPGMAELEDPADFYILVFNDVTEEEKEYYLSDCTLLSEETSTYVLIMDPTSVTSYGDKYYIDLYAPNSRGRVSCQQSLEYSVNSYVYSMQNQTGEDGELTAMAKLARATYNYGLSASAFKN